MMPKHRSPRRRAAQVLVESALVLPLMLTVSLGTLQFVLYAHARDVLTSAAQEGARLAAEDGRGLDEGLARARALIAAGLGASVDPFSSYSMRGSLEFTEEVASHVLDLMPSIAGLRVLRQWGGLCDLTPDYSPIIGGVETVKGFYLDVGWGTYGFKAGPIAGKCLAELIAKGKAPKLIEPFAFSRFGEGRLVGEKAAAAVSH